VREEARQEAFKEKSEQLQKEEYRGRVRGGYLWGGRFRGELPITPGARPPLEEGGEEEKCKKKTGPV